MICRHSFFSPHALYPVPVLYIVLTFPWSPHAQESNLLPHGLMLQPRTLCRVVTLLQDLSRPDLAEAAATALVHCCASPDEVRALLTAGATLTVSSWGVPVQVSCMEFWKGWARGDGS